MATITTAQTGNSNDSSTWTGGVVPGTSDVAQVLNGHTVTQSATHTWQSMTIDAGGTFNIASTYNLTLTANALSCNGTYGGTGTGTLTLTSVTAFANRSIIIGNNGVFSPQGSSISALYSIVGSTGLELSFQDTANTDLITITPRYCYFNYLGDNSDTTTNVGLYYHSTGKASNVNFQDCFFQNYGRLRSPQGSISASGVHLFERCLFLDPIYDTGNKYASEYTTGASFDAGTRGWIDCAFIGNDGVNQHQIYIDGSTNTWTNPLLVQNCLTEDVQLRNRFCNYVAATLVARADLYTTSGQILANFSARSTAQGGFTLTDSVFHGGATHTNMHSFTMGGGDNLAPLNAFTIKDNFSFASDTGSNHYLWTCGGTFEQLVCCGGQALGSTEGVTTETVNIKRITLIAQTGRPIDNAVITETNEYLGTINATSILIYGNNQAGEECVSSNVAGGQTVGRVGYNNPYNIGGTTYNNITISDDQTANDINADPGFANFDADIETWDTSLGGGGTVANAFNEICINLTGLDRAGTAQTKDANYTRANLLTYLRAALAPTNSALQAAGDAGVDIGALAVIVSSARKTGLGLSFGRFGRLG